MKEKGAARKKGVPLYCRRSEQRKRSGMTA
jgi:hypothetical protein